MEALALNEKQSFISTGFDLLVSITFSVELHNAIKISSYDFKKFGVVFSYVGFVIVTFR